jgi:predicted anti-sigma-YlaC factor YlaD
MSEHPDALTLTAWTEGQLPNGAEWRRVAQHVVDCPDCRALSAEHEQTSRLLSRLPVEDPPPSLAQNIVAAVRRQQEVDRRREAELRRGELAWRRVAAASVVCALAGLALVVVAWPDVLNVATAAAGTAAASANAPQATLTALLDLPLETLGQIASSTVDWGTMLTQGAGAGLLLGLVLLTAAAFGGLAQLLHSGAAAYAVAAE